MKFFTILFPTLLCFFTSLAQQHGKGKLPHNSHTENQSLSGNSGTGSNINVIYQRCNWRINPDSTSSMTPINYIKGVVDLKFVTIEANVSSISFDLNDVLTINSIAFRGVALAGARISRASNVVTVTLGVTLPINTIDSIKINYQGVPPIAVGAAQGYQMGTTLAGQNFISTLSESYEDRDWWPCKADMQDKIDSMDIIVSVPWSGADTFWVATNGHLYDSSIISGNRIFKTKVTYPIASYLVSVSVARYDRLYSSVTLPSGFVLKGHFYIFRGKTTAEINRIRNHITAQNQLVFRLSEKFGDYPFKNEKYGFYEGILGAGGMEHQGFYGMASSVLNSTSATQPQATLSHELVHQWFGDKVTFQTWRDLWLAEGFARYGEALAGEIAPATGLSFSAELSAARSAARGSSSSSPIRTAPIRLPNITTSNTIWSAVNTTAVYDKGAMIVSMLRALSGDQKFYQALRTYLDVSAPYTFANTDTLKNIFSRTLGYDLTNFFDAWVSRYGHPTTNVTWNRLAGGTLLALSVGTSQPKTSGSNVTYFPNPVIVRVQGALAGQDTTIVFLDIDGNAKAKAGNGIHSQVTTGPLYYQLSFVPTTVSIDPNNLSLATQGTVTLSATVDLSILEFAGIQRNNENWLTLILDDNTTNTEIALERSIDGVNFSSIGAMKLTDAVNNQSNSSKVYLFRDLNIEGISYYRASFKNQTGNTLLSKTVKLVREPAVSVKAFSVFVSNNQDLVIAAQKQVTTDGRINIDLYDSKGALVKRVVQQWQNGQKISLPIASLAAGVYVIEIKSGQNILQVQRFVK